MRVGPAFALGLLGVLTVGIGRIFGLIEMYVLGTAMVAGSIVAIGITRARIVLIDVDRHQLADEPRAGRELGIEMKVRVLRRSPGFTLQDHVVGPRSVPLGRIEFDAPPMRRNEEVVTKYALRPESRGVVTLGPATVEFGDPLGLAHRSRPVGRVDEVVVAPGWTSIALPRDDESEGDLVQAIRDLTRHLAAEREFRSLREYSPGDDARTVNWKASAKRDVLVVNEYESRSDVMLDVFLDDDSAAYSLDGFERAVCVAASFVGSAEPPGSDAAQVRLSFAGADEDSRFDSVIGESNRRQAMRSLSLLQPSPRSPRPRPASSASLVSVPVLICGRRSLDWLEWARREMRGSKVVVAVMCEPESSVAAPERWFVLDAPDFESFVEQWAVISRPRHRR